MRTVVGGFPFGGLPPTVPCVECFLLWRCTILDADGAVVGGVPFGGLPSCVLDAHGLLAKAGVAEKARVVDWGGSVSALELCIPDTAWAQHARGGRKGLDRLDWIALKAALANTTGREGWGDGKGFGGGARQRRGNTWVACRIKVTIPKIRTAL